MSSSARRVIVALVALGSLVSAAACGAPPARDTVEGTTVRLAYLPNLTHAGAIVGVETGIFRDHLGPNKLRPQIFSAGPDIVGALFAGSVDIAYLGPNPTVNAYEKSGGRAIKVVSGATSGGVALVVKPSIQTVSQLRGESIATPQLGGTQDVAARSWLAQQGFRSTFEGGGEVSVLPQANAAILEAFKAGSIGGAWVPEPWATRLVIEGGGRVLVDERSLWPEGRFVTANVVVSTDFLRRHPDVVARLLEAHLSANQYLAERPEEAKQVLNDALERYTGKRISPPVLDRAWSSLEFTDDPIEASLVRSATAAYELGLFKAVPDLDGLYDLRWRDAARIAVEERSAKR